MSGKRPNLVETTGRLIGVKDLRNMGFSAREIADKLGCTERVIQRDVDMINELSLKEIDPGFLSNRRMEIDLEYLQAIEEAKEMYFIYKKGKRNEETGEIIEKPAPLIAKEYHERWTQTLAQRTKLFGLDSIKIEANTFNQYNTNTQNNLYPIEKTGLSDEKLDKIAQILTED